MVMLMLMLMLITIVTHSLSVDGVKCKKNCCNKS